MALSTRGAATCALPMAYFSMHAACVNDAHSPENAAGYCSFAVAENRLAVTGAFAAKLHAAAGTAWQEASAASYDSFLGRQRFRAAFAAFVQREVVTSGVRVDPAHLCVSAGCGALLEHLAFSLCDTGEAILLPTPTYPALYNDFCTRTRTEIVDVPMEQHGYRLHRHALQAAHAAALAAGRRPRILCLLNPHNPTGTVATADELGMAIDFCRANGMHLVVDEIYANTMLDGSDGAAASAPAFTSIVDVMAARAPAGSTTAAAAPAVSSSGVEEEEGVGATPAVDTAHAGMGVHDSPAAAVPAASTGTRGARYMGDDVHVMWGFSKDWGLSGLRVGVLFTHNAGLLAALANANYFSGVSNYLQDAMAAVLDDDVWCADYLADNRAHLVKAYGIVSKGLQAAGLPFLRASGGMFVWLDMRSCLASAAPGNSGWEAERAMVQRLFDDHRILLTPGEACHATEPGFCRLCFAWMPLASLEVGMARLKTFAEEHGRGGGVPGAA